MLNAEESSAKESSFGKSMFNLSFRKNWIQYSTTNSIYMGLVVALLLFSVTGCGNKTEIPNFSEGEIEQNPSQKEDGEDATASSEQLKKDLMPPLDQIWTPTEYQDVAKILRQMLSKDAFGLPRFGDEKSGELFAKITSKSNFDTLQRTDVDPKIRAALVGKYAEAIYQISSLYNNRSEGAPDHAVESLELYRAFLYLMAGSTKLFDEISAIPDQKIVDSQARRIHMNATSVMVQEVFRQIQDKKRNPLEARKRVFSTVQEVFPVIWKVIPTDQKIHTVIPLIEEVIATETNAELKESMKKVFSSVRWIRKPSEVFE